MVEPQSHWRVTWFVPYILKMQYLRRRGGRGRSRDDSQGLEVGGPASGDSDEISRASQPARAKRPNDVSFWMSAFRILSRRRDRARARARGLAKKSRETKLPGLLCGPTPTTFLARHLVLHDVPAVL